VEEAAPPEPEAAPPEPEATPPEPEAAPASDQDARRENLKQLLASKKLVKPQHVKRMAPRGRTEKKTARGKRVADQGIGAATFVPKKKPPPDETMMFTPGGMDDDDDDDDSDEVPEADSSMTAMFTLPKKPKKD
jgi:hypothetical protein